jgi:hypothetical protein
LSRLNPIDSNPHPCPVEDLEPDVHWKYHLEDSASSFVIKDLMKTAELKTAVSSLLIDMKERLRSIQAEFRSRGYNPDAYYDERDPVLEDMADDIRSLVAYWMPSSC